MRLRCPNCRTDLDILPVETTVEVKCPSCGSVVDISGSQDTIAYTPPKLGKLAHFELIEHIGRGHFGDVYKANDSRLNRIVAVKVPRAADLRSTEREAFLREARTAARLRHPNIVTIHDVNASGETTYIATEFIEGVNLADRIFGKPLAPRSAAELAAKIADALQHAHEQGVIHRDLKPRNIMLDAQGEPHLLDFGLAKRDAADFTITTAGEILGTPAYMAPEQARGDAHSADARTDVYSLGVTLYEMLTGTRPFMGDARGLIYQVLNDDPTPPRKLQKEIPRDLETICLKAMAKEPSRRYQSAGEMAADLKRFLAGDAIQARRAGMVERSWRWCRKNPAWCAAGGLGTAALVLLGVMVANGAWSGPPRRQIEIDVRLALGAFAQNGDPAAQSAKAVFWPLDAEGNPVTSRPIRLPASQPPLRVALEPGDYFVVVVGDGGRFHEVYRHVPQEGEKSASGFSHQRWELGSSRRILLPSVTLPLKSISDAMVRLSGSDDFVMGTSQSSELAPHHRSVPAFWLDRAEVTVGEYLQSPVELLDGATGAEDPNAALNQISHDAAAAWAEKSGKLLPTETQYEFAATRGGTHAYPWGNDGSLITDWPLETAAAYDRTDTDPPIVGLYSGVAEWTRTWMQFYPRFSGIGTPFTPREYRIVRGAPVSIIDGQPLGSDAAIGARFRQPVSRGARHASIGFRCARSVGPHLKAADFEQVRRDDE